MVKHDDIQKIFLRGERWSLGENWQRPNLKKKEEMKIIHVSNEKMLGNFLSHGLLQRIKVQIFIPNGKSKNANLYEIC